MFLRHEQCPKCAEQNKDRRGNNLGVWDDGHAYCFSCGYSNDSRRSLSAILGVFEKRREIQPVNGIPWDSSSGIRRDALSWLKKYGITDAEITSHNILWSESKELLVFPIFDGGMWQGRYFGDNPKHPKYVTYGLKDSLHIIGEKSSTIILVEDLISAIKISRKFTTMPIFGSDINRRLLSRLQLLGFNRVAIWLDPNMKQQMLKFVKRAEFYFERAVTVMSEKDPKDHTDLEIRKYIDKALA